MFYNGTQDYKQQDIGSPPSLTSIRNFSQPQAFAINAKKQNSKNQKGKNNNGFGWKCMKIKLDKYSDIQIFKKSAGFSQYKKDGTKIHLGSPSHL